MLQSRAAGILRDTQPKTYSSTRLGLGLAMGSAPSDLDVRDYARRLHQYFKDEFDFLLVFRNLIYGVDKDLSPSGLFGSVSNNVEDIGEPHLSMAAVGQYAHPVHFSAAVYSLSSMIQGSVHDRVILKIISTPHHNYGMLPFIFRRRKVRLHPVGRIHSYMLLGIHKNLSLALRCVYFVNRGPRLNTNARNAGAQRPRTRVRAIALLMSYGLRISLWLRWFVVIAWLAQLHHHVGLAQPAYLSHVLSAALLLAVNTLVLYRVETKRGVTWRWALALSAMDLALLTGGLTVAIGSEGAFFVLYYAALAMFAAVSSSFRVTLLATTVVAAVHAALSLSTGPGGTLEIQPDPVLLLSILAMYAAVSAVSLVSRFERNRSWFERVRRREAVERGEELQQERIELSQTIHNTIAQSAYLIGLGLETAIELADGLNDESRDELLEKLEATLALSRSTMWDLRHPINVGPIFEGRELGRVLRSHASTFSTITSIPTEVVQVGQEPLLSVLTRRLLLSIAHNALSNAHRHSNADNITIELFFDNSTIRLSVTDDGIGLPSDYCLRGQGFRNMRLDAERMGGWLEAGPGKSGRGTTITCVVPLGSDKGGP